MVISKNNTIIVERCKMSSFAHNATASNAMPRYFRKGASSKTDPFDICLVSPEDEIRQNTDKIF